MNIEDPNDLRALLAIQAEQWREEREAVAHHRESWVKYACTALSEVMGAVSIGPPGANASREDIAAEAGRMASAMLAYEVHLFEKGGGT